MIQKQIDDAIREGSTIEILYTKYGGETSTRIVSDIHYSEEYGSSYIEGFCHTRKEMRTFKLSRISRVTVVQPDLRKADTSSSSVSEHYVFDPKKRIFNLYES